MPSTPSVPPANALLAALERYALHATQLTARWMDAQLYSTVSEDMEAIRRACQAQPGLGAAWVSLLIAHAELMHALWQAPATPRDAGAADRERLLARVQDEVRTLRAAGLRLAPRC